MVTGYVQENDGVCIQANCTGIAVYAPALLSTARAIAMNTQS